MEEHGLRILVVDDDEALRTALADALAKAGYSVSIASNGKQGLEEIMKQHFEVVVTDFQMPLMNGLELLACCRQHAATTPVIVISGAARDLEQVAVACGAFGVIPKPLSPRTVVQMVQRATQVQSRKS